MMETPRQQQPQPLQGPSPKTGTPPQLVWAKYSTLPPWPGLAVDPNSLYVKNAADVHAPGKNYVFVWFFGSHNIDWVDKRNIVKYQEGQKQQPCSDKDYKPALAEQRAFVERGVLPKSYLVMLKPGHHAAAAIATAQHSKAQPSPTASPTGTSGPKKKKIKLDAAEEMSMAIENSDGDAVFELMKECPTLGGYPLVHCVAYSGSVAVLNDGITKGLFQIDALAKDNITALHHCVTSGKCYENFCFAPVLHSLRQLIKSRTSSGETVLHVATRFWGSKGQWNILDYYLDCILAEKDGLSIVNAQDSAGMTALMHCSHYGAFESVTRLLKAGADPAVLNNQGQLALHLAASDAWCFDRKSFRKIVNSLRNTVGVRSTSGETLLQVVSKGLYNADPHKREACRFYMNCILDELPCEIIDINSKDVNGKTVLMSCAMADAYDLVHRLIGEFGANPRLRDNDQEMAHLMAPRDSITATFLAGAVTAFMSFDRKLDLLASTIHGENLELRELVALLSPHLRGKSADDITPETVRDLLQSLRPAGSTTARRSVITTNNTSYSSSYSSSSSNSSGSTDAGSSSSHTATHSQPSIQL